MELTRVREVTDPLVEAMQGLVAQLSPSALAPTRALLERIAASEHCVWLVARDGGRVVGSLVLVLSPIPTGLKAYIEDVVVDRAARGAGVGERLVREALRHAREAGALKVELTSNPTREAANRLYQRLGFRRRETNAYRHDLA